jgi:polyhydroxyalkanoate synthesis repressor PhaR
MVRDGEEFQVTDARTGEDITRSVLAQIIFEEESKQGAQNLLPSDFLKQLIRFYGDSLQAFVPGYLQMSMQNLLNEQQKLREQVSKAFGANPFQAMEEMTRRNMGMFMDAFRIFAPYAKGGKPEGEAEKGKPGSPDEPEINDLKRQLADVQARLDRMDRR